MLEEIRYGSRKVFSDFLSEQVVNSLLGPCTLLASNRTAEMSDQSTGQDVRYRAVHVSNTISDGSLVDCSSDGCWHEQEEAEKANSGRSE